MYTLTLRCLVFCLATLVTLGAQAQRVKGSGSTFAAALYSDWGDQFATKLQTGLDYAPTGSSTGVKRIVERAVDFGASDRPLGRKELESNSLAQFPTAVGGVVLVTNLPGIPSEKLKLDGATLAGIYSGAIKTWNHPAIAALNAGVTMPSLPIVPVFRSDGSGTSFVFTSYLSRVSSQFNTQIGTTSNLAVLGGKGAPSNREVVVTVKDTPGGIGYTDFSFTSELGIGTVQLKNRWGVFVAAGTKGMQDAVRTADWELVLIDQDPTFALDLADAPCPSCWPITTVTYVLVPLKSGNANSSLVLDFFEAALSADGDAAAIASGYVPLPSRAKSIVKISMRRWQTVLERNGGARPQRRSGSEHDGTATDSTLMLAMR